LWWQMDGVGESHDLNIKLSENSIRVILTLKPPSYYNLQEVPGLQDELVTMRESQVMEWNVILPSNCSLLLSANDERKIWTKNLMGVSAPLKVVESTLEL